MVQTSWVVPVLDAGGGGTLLQLPDELLERLGWGEGDNLCFEDRGDGALLVTRQECEDKELAALIDKRLSDGKVPVSVRLDEL